VSWGHPEAGEQDSAAALMGRNTIAEEDSWQAIAADLEDRILQMPEKSCVSRNGRIQGQSGTQWRMPWLLQSSRAILSLLRLTRAPFRGEWDPMLDTTT
jgi:hypothetical protein